MKLTLWMVAGQLCTDRPQHGRGFQMLWPGSAVRLARHPELTEEFLAHRRNGSHPKERLTLL